MTQRTAVLFLTHKWNQLVRAKLDRLRREVGNAAEVSVLLQSSPGIRRAIKWYPDEGQAAFLFDPAKLPRLLGYPYFRGDSIVPGSTHFPLLAFFRTQPKYDYYLLVEFDVEFSGHWRELVEKVTEAAPDFASSHIQTPEDNPDWYWWGSLTPPGPEEGWAQDKQGLRKAFNPLYCLSRRALARVDEAHRNGWQGHYEVLLATLLTRAGCNVVDLAEIGGFYLGDQQDPPEDEPPAEFSTMRWRPRVTAKEFERLKEGRTLFHPVKGRWFYDGENVVSFGSRPDVKGRE